MTKNIFTFATASEIAQFNEKTAKTARKVNKNFSEEEKQLITPKQVKKNAPKQVKKNVSKQT